MEILSRPPKSIRLCGTRIQKIAGPGYSREFIEDALGLAGVYQAQGSHMHAVTAYKSIFVVRHETARA